MHERDVRHGPLELVRTSREELEQRRITPSQKLGRNAAFSTFALTRRSLSLNVCSDSGPAITRAVKWCADRTAFRQIFEAMDKPVAGSAGSTLEATLAMTSATALPLVTEHAEKQSDGTIGEYRIYRA